MCSDFYGIFPVFFAKCQNQVVQESFESDGLNSILDSGGLIDSIDFDRLDFYGRKDRFRLRWCDCSFEQEKGR